MDGVEDEYESEVAPLRAQWAAHKELYLIPDADAEADHSALLLAQQIQTATKKVFSLTQDQSVQELLNNEK